MVDFYVTQVRAGKLRLEDIPERFRKAVCEKLESEG